MASTICGYELQVENYRKDLASSKWSTPLSERRARNLSSPTFVVWQQYGRRNAEDEGLLKIALLLPVLAGAAIAVQTVLNSLGIRSLGLGALTGFSGLVTSLLGFASAAAFLSRPEPSGRALLCALGSELIGAFVLAAIVLSARATGLGQTLSVLIASQLLVGLLVDRAGLFGASVQELSAAKVLGAALIMVGGVLVVRF